MSFDIANTQCEEKLIFLQGQNWPKNRISPSNEIWPLQNQIYGQSNYLTSKVCIFVAFFWQIEHQFTPLIDTCIITNPKIHLLVKLIFHGLFFIFRQRKHSRLLVRLFPREYEYACTDASKIWSKTSSSFITNQSFFYIPIKVGTIFFYFPNTKQKCIPIYNFFSAPNERIENSYLQNTNSFAKTLSPFL